MGRNAFVSFSFNDALQREKVKFTLDGAYSSAQVYRPCMINALLGITGAMQSSITTDKGHTSSNGRTVIEFWLQQLPGDATCNVTSAPAMSVVPDSGSKDAGHAETDNAAGLYVSPDAGANDVVVESSAMAAAGPLDATMGDDVVRGGCPDHGETCSALTPQAEDDYTEEDVPGKSWDRKRFETMHGNLKDESISTKVWTWMGDRYALRFGKSTPRCNRMLEGLSEKELLASIRFLKSGDELDLAVPFYKVAHAADVETAAMEPDESSGGAASSTSANAGNAGTQLAGISKRGMAQPKDKRRKR